MALPDDINLGPLPEESSSQPISSSPSVAGAGAEMPAFFRLFQKVDSERTNVNLNQSNTTAALQAGLGRHNYGFSGLTMEQVHTNRVIASQAAAVLTRAFRMFLLTNFCMGASLVHSEWTDQVIESKMLYSI